MTASRSVVLSHRVRIEMGGNFRQPRVEAAAVRFSEIGCVSSQQPSLRFVMPALVARLSGSEVDTAPPSLRPGSIPELSSCADLFRASATTPGAGPATPVACNMRS